MKISKPTMAYIVAIFLEMCMILFTAYMKHIHADLTYPSLYEFLDLICGLFAGLLTIILMFLTYPPIDKSRKPL